MAAFHRVRSRYRYRAPPSVGRGFQPRRTPRAMPTHAPKRASTLAIHCGAAGIRVPPMARHWRAITTQIPAADPRARIPAAPRATGPQIKARVPAAPFAGGVTGETRAGCGAAGIRALPSRRWDSPCCVNGVRTQPRLCQILSNIASSLSSWGFDRGWPQSPASRHGDHGARMKKETASLRSLLRP